MSVRPPRRLALVLVVAALGLDCRKGDDATPPTSAAAPPTEAAATPASAGAEADPASAPDPAKPPPSDPALAQISVHPGINDHYYDNPQPRYWRKRLERDGREVHDRRPAILKALALKPGMRVADVGAGTGLFTLDFARAVGPTGAVYAVDLMPTFLEHIAAKAAKAGLTNVTTIAATASSCNLPAGSVDLAYMSDAYHHVENPPAYLASLRRALAPAGELVIIDFKRIPGESSAWLLDHVRAGKEEVIGELEDAGFEVVADLPILEENYFLRLRLRADAAP